MGTAKNSNQDRKDTARSRRANAQPKGGSVYYDFVRCRLTRADLEDFNSQFTDGEFGIGLIVDYLDEGYKVSFSQRKDSEAYTCTLSIAWDEHPNAGLLLSSFAPTIEQAFALNVYKDRVLAADGMWATIDRSSEADTMG